MGVGARLAPACSHFSYGLTLSALPISPPSFSPNLVLQSKLARSALTIARESGRCAEVRALHRGHFKVIFWKKYLNMFWSLKTYSVKKRFMGLNFQPYSCGPNFGLLSVCVCEGGWHRVPPFNICHD